VNKDRDGEPKANSTLTINTCSPAQHEGVLLLLYPYGNVGGQMVGWMDRWMNGWLLETEWFGLKMHTRFPPL